MLPNAFIFIVLLAHIGIVALVLLLGYIFVHRRQQKKQANPQSKNPKAGQAPAAH